MQKNYVWQNLVKNSETLINVAHVQLHVFVISVPCWDVRQELLTLPEHLSLPPFFTCLSRVRVVNIVKLHVFTFLVPCCDVQRDIRVQTIFGSSSLPFFCRVFMLNLCYLCLFMHTDVQHDFHVWWCSCRLTVTRRMLLVEQELLTLLVHLSSSQFLWGFMSLNL
jgi:hypothetical protein